MRKKEKQMFNLFFMMGVFAGRVRMLNVRVFVVLIFVLVPYNLVASYPFVRNFSKTVSKVGNQNWDIVQHHNQWLYFANNKGLLEFDGFHWALYPNQSQTVVRSLYYDSDKNRIYIGSFNEFGYYERTQNGVLAYKKLSDTKKFNIFSDIWNIHKLNNAMVYQADFDIVVANNDTVKIFKFDDKINYSAVVNNKLVVSQLNKGIRFFDGHKFVDYNDNGLLKKKVVRSILPYHNNNLLFVTDLHGIFIYNGTKFSKFKTDVDEQLMRNEVFCAAIQNNLLALGTVQNGLIVKNLADNTSVFLNNETGLQNNTVLSVSFDNRNNLWLGLDKGIDYVVVNSATTDLIGNSNIVGAGYSSLIYNDKLYLATNQGLYYKYFDNKTLQAKDDVFAVSNIKGQVWNLTQIGDEVFCSCDKGLYVFNKANVTKINGLNGVWNVKQLKQNNNILLGAEYNEFFVIKQRNGKWVKTNVVKGFNEGTKAFLEDNEGKIWISHTTNGIYRLTLNDTYDAFTKVEIFDTNNGLPSLRNVLVSEVQSQIIASTEHGFYFYCKKSNRFERSDWLNRLFGQPEYVSSIFVDNNTNVWSLSQDKIMFALKHNDSKYIVDSVSFNFLKGKLLGGFEHINFLSTNKALIASENGFSLFDNNTRVKDVVNSILVFKNIYITSPRDSLLNGYLKSQSDNSHPNISYSNNSLRFEFVSSEYVNENSMLYSVMLQNYDIGWSTYSNSNIKEYAKIPPGKYVFKVKAKNLATLRVENIDYAFTILPPWYTSSAAKGIYAILFLIAIYWIVRFVNYRTYRAARAMELRKEQEIKEQERQFLLEAKEKEKEFIALQNKQLEHELKHKSQDLASSTMNVIRKNEMLLEMKSHLDTISEQLKENKERQSISKQIQHLQKEISSNIEIDNNWVKFQENFDLVYENYLTRLSEAFSCLTQNDKKICAYLRMGLSSKDIAPLVNTTYQSVEMSRHRLRKKLNLDRSVNLTDFLHHF